MKGVILSGGKGYRLNLKYNKSLLLFNKRPLIHYNIDILKQYCDEIYIIVKYDKENVIKNVLNFYKNINFIHQTGNDIIDAFSSCIKYIQDDFFLCFGDEKIFDYNIKKMINIFYKKNCMGVLGSCKKNNLNNKDIKKTYSIKKNNDNLIINIVEKPNKIINNYQGTGYSIFNKKFFNYLKNSKNFPEIVQNAINNNEKIYMVNFCKNYFNINTIDDYQKLTKNEVKNG